MVGIFAPLSVPEFWVGGFGTGVAAGGFGLGDGGGREKTSRFCCAGAGERLSLPPLFLPREGAAFFFAVSVPGPSGGPGSLTDWSSTPGGARVPSRELV